MTSPAMGAETSPPVPPPLATNTATASCGSSAGAKPPNQLWPGTSRATAAGEGGGPPPAGTPAVGDEHRDGELRVVGRGETDEPVVVGHVAGDLGGPRLARDRDPRDAGGPPPPRR